MWFYILCRCISVGDKKGTLLINVNVPLKLIIDSDRIGLYWPLINTV